MKFVDAVVLLGWFERDQAVEFLRKGCHFDPPLSESKARRLWEKNRKAMNALGTRGGQSPTKVALTSTEQVAADALLQAFKGSKNIKDVIKIDPFQLVAHQLIVYTDHAKAEYANCNSANWCKESLPLPKPGPNLNTLVEGPYLITLDVPHQEFGIVHDVSAGVFRIQEMVRHVSVTEYSVTGYGKRLMLGAGYHRTYACICATKPDAIDRSLPMVLTTDADFLVSAAAPNQGLRAILCGPRPPLFKDFFDKDLAIRVSLPKVRHELHITARFVPIPV